MGGIDEMRTPPYTDGVIIKSGLFCGKCATQREINGHAFLFAEQGNPVGIRDTADLIRGAVCMKLPSFLRKQVIGRNPEKAGGTRCGNAEHASQKTYELYKALCSVS